ncbi:MAG: Gfo/Idh/MocA family oxidoreductase [Ruminococcaceae bacterium]|nr:Gfo/Idh/MocA family oxidoreductase [Oscillospiraceae bacterium]
MKKIKIAVVGVGSISGMHIKSYLANESVEVYAFCDINEKRLKYQGERYGVTRLYTDEAEMLAALPEIDAVSVCTWNSAHAPCTIMALNAGKHVLCEKPMATNVEDAEAMLAAAKKNGKLLMIGFVRRFGQDADTVMDLIEAGSLGEIYYAKAQNIRRNGAPGGWFGDKSRSGGGPLIDLGVHSIDLVRYLLGKPRAVSVYGSTFTKLGNRSDLKVKKSYTSVSSKGTADVYDCEDLATAMVRFDNGTVLSVEMSFSLNVGKTENSIQLFGVESGVHMESEVQVFGQMNGYLSDTSLGKSTGLDVDEAFRREIDHFVACLCDEQTVCRAPAEDGVELMRILTAIYQSAECGHEVTL